MKHAGKKKTVLLFCRCRLAYVVASVFVLGFIFVSSVLMYPKSANADGLFQEQLSASFGNRKADLLIKMTPPVVTTETLKTRTKTQLFNLSLLTQIQTRV